MSEPIIRRLADAATEPWKNGGGVTRTLATQGDDWRVSIATIAQDGVYSRFVGLQRLSMILSGAGVVLCGPDGPIELAPWVPVQYDGAPAWQVSLVDGPCLALNVMAREEAYRLSACLANSHAEIVSGAHALVLANGASVRVEGPEAVMTAILCPDEYAVLAPSQQVRSIVVDPAGMRPILILIEPATAG